MVNDYVPTPSRTRNRPVERWEMGVTGVVNWTIMQFFPEKFADGWIYSDQ